MAYKYYVAVGGDPSKKKENIKAFNEMVDKVQSAGLEGDVQVVKSLAVSLSSQGPVFKVLPGDFVYTEVDSAKMDKIIEGHLKGGKPVDGLLYDPKKDEGRVLVPGYEDAYQKQFRIVLRNAGKLSPTSIDEYIARDGYLAAEKALLSMKPEDVIEEMKKSALRGRGGAGFPTYMKWTFGAKAQADEKFLICNADEGDPGAYMDRSTLEGDPHNVLEGMIIGGYAMGATKGFIYIRAEYPMAIKHLDIAINQAREYGLLGENILGSGYSFDIEVRLGAGAFVCGEETALIASIEGERGMPRPKPPFPTDKGLWGKPSVINNVETLANVPVIINKGGDWFGSIGTVSDHPAKESKGCKVFALTGKVTHTGLIEVPMGTALSEIVFDIGGGIPHGKKFKAAQSGGPSGGMITQENLHTPIDYANLQAIGSIMGSGGLIVMDEDDCMVDVAKFYLEFTVDESCGKCSPCRIGGKQMWRILDKISKGNGEMEDIGRLERIGHAMSKASLCGLGQTAPNPVMSALRYFKDEVVAHIVDKVCPAGKCKDLVSYSIDAEKCTGCTACARKCPANCIAGEKREPHVIDSSACIKCGECYNVCKFDAVLRS